MEQIIIYKSKTGFTKRYATWLQASLMCDCVSFERAQTLDFSGRDVIIFGSSFRSGIVEGLRWYREQILPLDKIHVVFITGAMPQTAPETIRAIEQNFTRQERDRISIFYLQSGLNYEQMTLSDRLLVRMFCSTVRKKSGKTEEEKNFAEQVQRSFDCMEPAKMEPMLNYLQGL